MSPTVPSDWPPAGTVALVTGAGAGIGRSTALALAAIGCRVVCAGRRPGPLAAVCAEIGEQAHALELDVTDPASVDTLLERLPREWREIGILVNNAGHDVGGRRPFHEGDADQWARVVETNVVGLIRVTRRVIDGMRERDRGHVVNLGSNAGLKPYATGAPYVASKYAVHGFSESLRLDYAGTGVRVTEILPGMVRTEFAATRFGDEAAGHRYYEDFGVCLEPEDVARAIVFAVQQPPHVVISALVVLPSGQT